MIHLNKLLKKIEENPMIFKSKDLILILGLTTTQIKDLKKNALENQFITQTKSECYLTQKGKEYLNQKPLEKWNNSEFNLRPEINTESLKEEKAPPTLTKAFRNLAKHLLEKEPLKEFTLEHSLFEDIKKCDKLISEISKEILNGKRKNLEKIYQKYLSKGLSKSLISLILLHIISYNIEKIAVYEKMQ